MIAGAYLIGGEHAGRVRSNSLAVNDMIEMARNSGPSYERIRDLLNDVGPYWLPSDPDPGTPRERAARDPCARRVPAAHRVDCPVVPRLAGGNIRPRRLHSIASMTTNFGVAHPTFCIGLVARRAWTSSKPTGRGTMRARSIASIGFVCAGRPRSETAIVPHEDQGGPGAQARGLRARGCCRTGWSPSWVRGRRTGMPGQSEFAGTRRVA